MVTSLCPPGPPGHPLVGHLAEFRRDRLGFYTACARRYGDAVALRLGPRRLLLLSHPDDIETVLVTHQRDVSKHFFLRMSRPVVGDGLFTAEGAAWRRQRRLAQPAFYRRRVAAYGAAMVEAAERHLATWHHGETRDLHADLMRLTLDIVTQALFSAEVGGAAGEVGAALNDLLRAFMVRVSSPLPLPFGLPTPTNLRLRRAVGRLDRIVYRIIRERRAAGTDRGDLLSMLLQAEDEDGGRLDDRQVRDQMLTLFIAGHETTAAALAWTWYLLAQHPRVEAQLGAELRLVLAGRSPTVDDLPQLRYAERVVTEAMRLFPPVWGMGREAITDFEVGGYPVPAGTTLLMSQWVVHHDGRFWPEPEVFWPERWTEGLGQPRPRFAYFPFGGGPRACIGSGFAMVETVLLLATIASRFHLALAPGPPVVPEPLVTLRPGGGLPVVLHRR